MNYLQLLSLILFFFFSSLWNYYSYTANLLLVQSTHIIHRFLEKFFTICSLKV